MIEKKIHFQSSFDLKSHQDDGFFYGYASVFDVIDHHHEKVLPKAFKSSLEKWQLKNRLPKMLWQHDLKKPVGVWHEIREDEYGLFVKGQLLLDVASGREAYALMKAGVIDSLSIGFRPVRSRRDGKSSVRLLEEVDLMEISLVTFGANSEAKITDVKELDCHDVVRQGPKVEAKDQPNEKKELCMNENTKCEELIMVNEIKDKLSDYEEKSSKRFDLLETALRRPGISLSGEDSRNQNGGFSHFLRKGIDDYSQKAMISSSDKEGGYLIPESSIHLINQHLKEHSPLRQFANTVTVGTASYDLLLDRVEAVSGWVGETDDRPETKVSDLVKISIPVHEIYAKPRVSQRLLDDASINIESWLSEKIAQKMVHMENQAFLYGDGQGKPKGILTYPQVATGKGEWGKFESFQINAQGKEAANDLIDAFYSLKADYLAGSCWMMSPKTAASIRKLQEKSGAYLWQNSFSSMTPSTLLGYPVYLCDELDSDKGNMVLFGNLRETYQIVDRQQMSVLRDPYSAKPYVEFYATKRVGGDVINFDALKVISFVPGKE